METFLNSKDWYEFRRALGHKSWRFILGGIEANIFQRSAFGKNYLEVPHPAITPRLLTEFLPFIKRIAGKEKSIFIRVEPRESATAKALGKYGFRKASRGVQPQKTILLDLDKSESELWRQLSHGAKRGISHAKKKHLLVRELRSIEFSKVWPLFQKTAQRSHFSLHQKKHYQLLLDFRGEEFFAKLFGVYQGGQLLAAAIFGYYRDTMYYLHAASDNSYKNLEAPRLLIWETMQYARSHQPKAISYLDLWGIDQQYLSGVTRFKQSFGGRIVEYPGTFDLVVSRFWYLLYGFYQNLR